MSVPTPRVSADGHAAAIDDSPLALTTRRLAAGSRAALGDDERDLLLFGSKGEASLETDGAQHRLGTGEAALLRPGAAATLDAATDAEVIEASVAGDVDLHAPMGPTEPGTRLEAVEPGQATGSRSFQVLYGPHNGSVRATLFVGYIPPGRAPWHYHLYDEIVWVLRGSGRLHLRDRRPEELAAGCAFRLRAREVHIVENLAAGEELAVLGLFTPAGSPSAAYLEPRVLAGYRIG